MRSGGHLIGLVTLALVGCALEAQPDESESEPEPADVSASTLQCPTDLMEAGDIDYLADAHGLQGDPVEAVGHWLAESLEASDELVMAQGLPRPSGTTESVGVIRDGSRIALVHLMQASDGGWLVSSFEGCAGTLAFP